MKKAHLNTFPAIHLKKLDAVDYSLKFSSELLVLLMAVVVAGLNIYFFSGQKFSDKSFAAEFLNNHTDLNQKLYAKNNSTVTTITRSSSLFPQAQADDFAGFNVLAAQTAEANDANNAVLSEDSIVQLNPDSIQGLLDKQIKIYETKQGDTLASIAAANGINQQTIKWANNLTADQIKPGWYLLIPPVNGIIAKADSNTTLPDLANKYNPERYNSNKQTRDASADKLLDTIISYNSLANAEDIDAGQIVIIPGGVVATPPAAPKPATPSKPGTVTPPRTYDAGTGHIFPWGYCTYYVATKVHVPWGGNAKNWLANAKAYGAVVSKTPAVGSIVVTTDNSYYGHVALVEKVEDDRFMVSEMNYKGKGIVSTRWISNTSRTVRGFIYP